MIDLRIVPTSAFPLALENNLRRLGLRDKTTKHFLRAIRWSFDADSAWFCRRLRHNLKVQEKLVSGDESLCPENLVEPFARLEYPAIPKGVLLAPFRPHGRVEAVTGVARRDRGFETGRGRYLNRLTALLAKEFERRDAEATCQAADRIQTKALSGLPARDLAYHIFDALHQRIRYDHSATLMLYEPVSDTLRIIAEKIVWEKAKSTRIGTEVLIPPGLVQKLNCEGMVVLDREVLGSEETQEVTGSLIAPVDYRSRLKGLLRLASAERLPFDAWDRVVVERFLPVTAYCLSVR
jgi:hypothetical protein